MAWHSNQSVPDATEAIKATGSLQWLQRLQATKAGGSGDPEGGQEKGL